MTVFEFEAKTIDGENVGLRKFEGDVLLLVNVASKCGFTPQYEGLEKLHHTFHPRGFWVLGFPCNQFGAQEPGSDAEIRRFCHERYHVTFPLFSKVDVNGPGTHPLYVFLKGTIPGILGTQNIKWNFTKFLVDRSGRPMKRYAPNTKPDAIVSDIEAALAQVSPPL